MNNPNEIFTFPTNKKTDESINNQNNHFCRFTGKKCDKRSGLIQYPMGVCSVNRSDKRPIICPHRFLEDNLVFKNICMDAFGTLDNILLFSEVKLSGIGTFDFVLVKHKPISSTVDDFCTVEFQSDATTGTGALVTALKEYMKGINVNNKTYKFGMNTYNTIKLSYIQMLMKGQVMESWGKNIFWVLQNFVFDDMTSRFNLNNLEQNNNLNSHYHIYDLVEKGNIQKLKLIQKNQQQYLI